MFDNLLQLVKEHSGNLLGNDSSIPEEHKEGIMQTATAGIMDHLKGLMSGGGIDKLKEMFTGGDIANHPEVSNMTENVASDIAGKYGISQEQAKDVVSKVVPNVMTNLAAKTNDPNDHSFNLQEMLGSLTSHASEGLGGIMNKVGAMFGK